MRTQVGKFALVPAGLPEHRFGGQVEFLRARFAVVHFALSYPSALDYEYRGVARMRSRPGRVTGTQRHFQRPDAAVLEQHHFSMFRRPGGGGFGKGEARVSDTVWERPAYLEQGFAKMACVAHVAGAFRPARRNV